MKRMQRKWKSPILLLSLILLAALSVGIHKYVSQRSSGQRCDTCNVVFITIDTLRADHISPYGYSAHTSPFLGELASKSVVFDNAFSASSWTAPATTSIFTSLYPSQHGVITGFQATLELIKQGVSLSLNRIPSNVLTMGEMMAKAGFYTIGVADNINIGKEIGFNRGFELFKTLPNEGAERLDEEARKFLNFAKDKGRYFLYLHYMDPHEPYKQNEPHFSECMKGKDSEKLTTMLCAYDSEIKNVDSHIAALYREYGWDKNTIIIVTADHGEEFGDHGDFGHGHTLYSELIHVPLIIHHPNVSDRHVQKEVTTMDLVPTLAAEFAIGKEPYWEGRDLGDLLRGGEGWSDLRSLFSERLREKAVNKPELRSVVNDSWHYIQSELGGELKSQEVYQLSEDRREKKNLFRKDGAVSNRLTEMVAKSKERPTYTNPDEKFDKDLNEDLIKQLKSLGYFN